MNWTGRTLVIGMVAVAFAGCGPLSMERVPSVEEIRKIAGPFLIEADQIQGVYRNLDVDSMVFTYHTNVKTEEEFADALSAALAGSKWEKSPDAAGFLEFRRSFAKGDTSEDRPDMAMFASYEVCRLSFDPDSGTVVVASGQADSPKDDARFEDTSEGQWIEEVIWPKFDELRSKRPVDGPARAKGDAAGTVAEERKN